MPIAGIVPTTSDDKIVKGIDPDITSAVVVDVDDTIGDMVRYIDGADWAVDYYSLVLGDGDVSTQLDPQLPTPEQQYEVIHDLEIRVTSPIEATTLNELAGNADVPYGVTVKENDIIKARLATGIYALFIVDEVTSRSYNKNKLYNIHFKLLTTELKGPEYFETLENKTIRTFYFKGNDIHYTGDPIIVMSDVQWRDELEQYDLKILNNFKRKFVDRITRLPIIEMTYSNLYDPHIDTLYRRLENANNIQELASPPFDLDEIIHDTVIDAMFKGSVSTVARKYVKTYTPTTDRNATYNDIIVANYPIPYGIGLYYTLTDNADVGIIHDANVSTMLPVLDKEYLFSPNFYNRTGEVSILEKMLNDALDGKVILREELEPFLKALTEMEPYEQYRYSLFAIILVRYARNNINTIREVS